MAKTIEKKQDILVYITSKESKCDECGEKLGKGAWINLNEKRQAFCLSCAELDHLEFLPSGDACVSRRAKKYSIIAALVMKFIKHRKRYERQGILVEKQAIEKAEKECLDDFEVRKRKNERAAIKREELDKQYVSDFSEKIHAFFPACPKNRAKQIAEHACMKYSGRVGRTASAKEFNLEMIQLAVIAHIRHTETDYDLFLSQGIDKKTARSKVQLRVENTLNKWAA